MNGREIPAPPDSAVLFFPDAPQTDLSTCNAYINHSLYFISTDDSPLCPACAAIHFCSRETSVSCYEDLLAARINAARYYLQQTALSIREIATLCGYENDVVFMRLFKRRMGQTATEFRGQCR